VELSTLFILLALVLSCAADVVRPFLHGQAATSDTDEKFLHLQEAAWAVRRRLQAAADDEASGVMGRAAASSRRAQLSTELADLEQQLAALQQSDPVEKEVRSARKLLETQPPDTASCGNCGEPVQPGQRFCPSCGQPLHTAEDAA